MKQHSQKTLIIFCQQCNACHEVQAWAPVKLVDHNQTLGDCIGCHNDFVAIGKPITHIASTVNCGACHAAASWYPLVTIDHNDVIGSCDSCHSVGKSGWLSPTQPLVP